MSYTINNTDDVYKFTQILFDYLTMNGEDELADRLSDLADDCHASSEQALAEHEQALREVLETMPDLPPQHRQAIERSLDIIAHT